MFESEQNLIININYTFLSKSLILKILKCLSILIQTINFHRSEFKRLNHA